MPVYGANINALVSPYLKIWIEQRGVTVVGIIGEGTTKELVANWESPFQDMSLGGKFNAVGGVIQAWTGATSQTVFNSRQVWAGNEPYTFSLVFKLMATVDPVHEVERPLLELEKMMAPDLARINPIGHSGRAPQPVQICVGNKFILGDCIVRSISEPLDRERNQNGDLIRADVALQVETLTVVTKAELDAARV